MYQLGKLPATPDARDLRMAKYADIAAVLPKVPTRFGNGFAFKGSDWLMLGNANAGDCVFAGGAHEEMLLAKVLRGLVLPFTDESVLSDYSAVTGYDPLDPSTDQGTYTRDALGYRRATGLLDANGTRHKIGAYVALDPKDWEQLLAAVYIFGAVGIGFEFPASAWDQFDAGQPWDVTSSNSNVEGGHYVPVVGSMETSEEATCVTWAKRQVLTREFYEAYNDESWTFVPGELRPDGTGLHHVDTATLYADLKAIVSSFAQ